MKKVILVLAVSLSTIAFAQAQKGAKWLGGGITITSSDNGDEITSSSFKFTPTFGINLSDKWAVGGILMLGTSKSENTDTNVKTTSSSVGIVPFARFNLAPTSKLSFLLQGELPFESNNSETKTPIGNATISNETDYTTFGLEIKPGIAYSINSKFSVELLMPSLLSQKMYSGDAKGSNFSLGINHGYSIQNYLMNPTFGFVYKF